MRAFVHLCICAFVCAYDVHEEVGGREVRGNIELFCTGVNLALWQVFRESSVFKDSVLRGVVKV